MPAPAVLSPIARLDRDAAERAFTRTAGGLVRGNAVRVLHDASENYPAWLDAIAGARESILLENYMFDDDVVGRSFADALAERARAGVKVRVLLDWLGGWTWGNRKLRHRLREAGAEVRCFNRPRWENPMRWASRDHRKMIAVDGTQAFVSGLCISAKWTGGGAGMPAGEWRDVGVQIMGPAIAQIERAFAETWARTGSPLPRSALTPVASIKEAGDVGVRVIASTPSRESVYQIDQLVASLATRTLWLADAYFVGLSLYVQTLRAAAQDGVDVRLLVPGTSDIPVIRFWTRVGYRPLLEAGVRIFEWNGPMMHAKMAVADGRWARVGSTNLNVSSWISNWELDVTIEHERLAHDLEARYEQDLAQATEIVLRGRRFRTTHREGERRRTNPGSALVRGGRAAAGALRLVNRIARPRIHEGPRPELYFALGLVLLLLAAVVIVVPLLVAVPVALVALWSGGTFLVAGFRRLRKNRSYNTPSA